MIKIQDLKVNAYYIQAGTGIYFYVISNDMVSGSSPDNTLVYSYYMAPKKKWSINKMEVHSRTIEMDVKEIKPKTYGFPEYSKGKSNSTIGFKPGTMAPKKVEAPKHPARAAIEGNKNATHCVKCKQPTKELALFNSMTRWCPACE